MAKAELEILGRYKTPDEWGKRDAVIEAAKAWRGEQRAYGDPLNWDTEQELSAAVEALEEVERG